MPSHQPLTDAEIKQRFANTQCVVFDVDGVLTDNKLYFDDQGREYKAFNARDGLGLKLLLAWGTEVAIITGRKSAAARARLVDNLGLKHYYEGCPNKLQTLQQISHQQGWQLAQLAYVGDDLIDLAAIQAVGLGIAVADAEPLIKEHADLVLSQAGGQGAAREVCQLVLQAKQQWPSILENFHKAEPFTN